MPAKKATDRLIDAISSLKRAAHIENNIAPADDHWKNGHCLIATESEDSFILLKNLLAQALSDQTRFGEFENHEIGLCYLTFPAPESSCSLLAEQVENLTRTLIAPDHNPRSTRKR